MPSVTIIETGHVPRRLQAEHGSYPAMFERMLGAAGSRAGCETVRLADGQALPDPAGLDAILITGSPAGVYDGLDWIAPLEDFVRRAYRSGVPTVGICFGHQLMAQALGGTVRKSEKGWGLGRHVYNVLPGNGVIEGETLAVACSHQDQVIAPPAGARTVLSSAFTPHAGLLYANGAALSVQPHPEFDRAYAHALCELREGHASDAVVAAAKTSLEQPLDSARLGRAIAQFLLARPRARIPAHPVP